MKNNVLSVVGTKMSYGFRKTKMKAIKHSPEICIVGGVIGVVGSTILACRATLQLDDVLKEKRERVEEIHDYVEEHGYSEEYGEKEMQQELTITYLKTAGKVLKLYAPAIALGVLSISSIVASHNIMRKRNAALSAAYTALYKGFDEYRKRVEDRFGEDVEKEIRYGVKTEEVEEKKVTKSGKEKIEKKEVKTFDPNGHYSPYAVVFDSGCIGWTKDPEANKTILLQQQAYANQKLKQKGYLFLNEVYEMLGFEPTKAGHVVGWLYDEKHPVGDNYVDFGIWDIDAEPTRRFINGLETNIILDFNVDGNIYEMM